MEKKSEDARTQLTEEAEAMGLYDSNGWISVKDRLPLTNLEVLFYSPEGVTFGLYVWYGNFEDDYRWQCLISREYLTDITHWMPLPEPPK